MYLNSLRHSINSVKSIDTKVVGEVNTLNPITMVISILFVATGLFSAGMSTSLMQQYYTNDEYRLIWPGNSKEILATIIVIWLAFTNLIRLGYTQVGSQPMVSYLTVADFYFKT